MDTIYKKKCEPFHCTTPFPIGIGRIRFAFLASSHFFRYANLRITKKSRNSQKNRGIISYYLLSDVSTSFIVIIDN